MIDKEVKYLYVLDIIRIIIVFVVFLFHINVHLSFDIGVKIIDRFMNQGAVVMTSFFMLSGFVLYYLFGQKNFQDWNTTKDFYKKRFIKIYPLYIVSVILFYLFFCTHDKVTPFLWGMQIIPLQAFFPQVFNSWINGGVWFVSVIFFLYACFPYLAMILRQLKAKSIYFILGAYLIVNYFNIIQAYYPIANKFNYVSPFIRLAEFFIGMVVAKIFLQNEDLKLRFKSILVVILTILGIMLVGGLSNSTFINGVVFRKSYLNYNVFFIPIFALIMLICAYIKSGFLYEIAKTKVVQYLSKISYAFFLTQCFVIYGLKNFWKVFLHSDCQIFIVLLMTNILTAILAYELVQKPLSKVLINLSKGEK